MPKLIFRGVSLRYVDMRIKDGIILSRLHLTAEMTEPVAEEMGWQVALETDGWDSMKLSGELRLSEILMQVLGLKQELNIKADEAREFTVVCITENESTKKELRFLVVTTDHPSLVYEYWKAIGEGQAVLKASLATDEQRPLPLKEAKVEETINTATAKLFHCDYCEKGEPLQGSNHIVAKDGMEMVVPCQHAHAGLAADEPVDPIGGSSLASKRAMEALQ